MENIKIELSKSRHFEVGAIFLATLALPRAEASTVGGLIFSLCYRALRAQFDLTGPAASIEQPMKPIYVFRTEKEVAGDFKKFDRLMRDRMIAADMALALLKKGTGTLPATLPKDLGTFSLNELSVWASRKLPSARKPGGIHDQGNIETRIWRESLPVIHLAMALAVFSQAYYREGHGEIRPIEILDQPVLVEWLVESANEYADSLENSGVLGAKAPGLIRIQLVRG